MPLALAWTSFVFIMCLIKLDGAPKVNIISFDKYVHSFFHFVFTTLWFLVFRFQLKETSKSKPYLQAFFFSVLVGIVIELIQKYCTENRAGDVKDVAANVVGASLAICFCYLLQRSGFLDKITK
ncbi:VanZ family protein [Flavobacterium algicola]|uniref:VanZ family protein n=1 Tax=Flavobacterium algicola TaxID=556529 RepID=UPI001EFE00F4|nr:VanZ family protein [Flavobacterium algicola]MCG9791506.1 VanZ family protein [Flavobacterium algicola]